MTNLQTVGLSFIDSTFVSLQERKENPSMNEEYSYKRIIHDTKSTTNTANKIMKKSSKQKIK